jgi:hypothetical protein
MTVMAAAVADAALPEEPRACFVIGPLGDPHAEPGSPELRTYEEALEVYINVISAACKNVGISAVRSDEITSAGEITSQILSHLATDDVVIADISGFNPNVMHELGFRHAIRKFTVQIAEKGQLPFNVAGIRTIRFTRTAMAFIKARKELEEVLRAGLIDGFAAPAPLGRPPLDEKDGRVVEGVVVEEDELGPLDKMALAEEQLEAIAEDLNEITEILGEITTISNDLAPEIVRASQSGTPIRQGMAVLARYAHSISPTTDRLEKATQSFDSRMATLEGGIQVSLANVEATAPEDRDEEVAVFLERIIELAVVGRSSMESFNEMGTAAEHVFSSTRFLRTPSKNISSSVKHLGAAVERMEDWARTARRLR